MLLIAILSLFMTEPVPLDMPRAEAYLVREKGVARLEDRYERQDLWLSEAVIGRWIDGDGRVFVLSCLASCPPAVDRSATVTRSAFAEERRPMKRVRANADFPPAFRAAIGELAPCETVAEPRSPRQKTRGFKEIFYWQHPTNRSHLVCTFLPERTNVWYQASWSLAANDDPVAQIANFEDVFLGEEFADFAEAYVDPARVVGKEPSERDLLGADAHHAVAAYPNWHFTSAREFAVIDDLPGRSFVETLTNDFRVMRAKYAAAIPSPLDGSNVLSVVRLYADRGEYLAALSVEGLTNMAWSAACWCPRRRELLAYLSEGGERELLRTVRHEAFHQYLTYATATIGAAPWLNEGYAQYFEDGGLGSLGGLEGLGGLGSLESLADADDDEIDRMAEAIPGLLLMDYEQFYDGTDLERHFKYRLAWSIVHFLENGADDVRLKPFEGLKRRYLETVVETHDLRAATQAAFKDAETLGLFLREWGKYWKKAR